MTTIILVLFDTFKPQNEGMYRIVAGIQLGLVSILGLAKVHYYNEHYL